MRQPDREAQPSLCEGSGSEEQGVLRKLPLAQVV